MLCPQPPNISLADEYRGGNDEQATETSHEGMKYSYGVLSRLLFGRKRRLKNACPLAADCTYRPLNLLSFLSPRIFEAATTSRLQNRRRDTGYEHGVLFGPLKGHSVGHGAARPQPQFAHVTVSTFSHYLVAAHALLPSAVNKLFTQQSISLTTPFHAHSLPSAT